MSNNNPSLYELSPDEWDIIRKYRATTKEKIKDEVKEEKIIPPEQVKMILQAGDYEFSVESKKENYHITKKKYGVNKHKRVIGKIGNIEFVEYLNNKDYLYVFLNGQSQTIEKFDARKLMSISMKIAHRFKLMKK